MSVQQPPWKAPTGPTHQPDLAVYNSLTKSKVPFVPIQQGKVTWYACGPTVYDDAHLGHARNYVATDIIRRVLRDYFGFDIRFVMNITDVDDKIILRARQKYLYDLYKANHRYITDEVRQDVYKSWLRYLQKNLPIVRQEQGLSLDQYATEINKGYGHVLRGEALVPGEKPGDAEAKIKMHINTANNVVRALAADPKTLTPEAFYTFVNDPMCAVLDAEKGKEIRGDDHTIFTTLTKEYEKRFFQDMDDLNVLRPDEIVRVTEHGQQISDFVDKIVQNQFAYPTADGSVYFDIRAFEQAGNPYARLEPWNRGNSDLQADGEGALSQKTGGKRSQADFALWKASKAGEPYWPPPASVAAQVPGVPGRPGWHIECSAMASERLGRQMDIHSGGIDLAFPHHDNELAQSEAFWHQGAQSQWVNYFLHMGHLSIQGAKMSKSLKNFTTVRSALDKKEWTSRSLRIVFLLGNWRDPIEITDSMVKEGTNWEDRVDNFFINAIEAVKTADSSSSQSAGRLEKEIKDTEDKIYQALSDSFNTPPAMAAIASLINIYNATSTAELTTGDHWSVAQLVTRMVNVLGLNGNEKADGESLGWKGIEIPEAAKEFVYPLAQIRDELRQAAIAKSITPETVQNIVSAAPTVGEPAPTGRPRPSFARAFSEFRANALQAALHDESRDINKEILALCDKVRDVDLWNLNIYLEDRENAPALVRPVTEGLRAARREKDDRTRQKEQSKKKRDQEARDKLEKGRLSPVDMFKPPNTDDFSAWDQDGMPTKMKDGSDVNQSKLKKLRKFWDSQRKAHEQYLKAVKGTQHAAS